MNAYEAEAVRDVIEQLVIELGATDDGAISDDVDVDGALDILNREILNGSEEERTEIAVEADEEQLV